MGDALEQYLIIENEDDLTSIVFGILELVDVSVLTDVLEIPQETLSDEFTIEFQQRIDPRAERVPDVLISDATTSVVIEAKRGTNFDMNQLREEHEDLQQYGSEEKELIAISGHESEPSRINDLDLSYLEWHGWGEIAHRIARCDRSELTDTQRQLLNLLEKTLEKEGYMPFVGFSNTLLEELPTVWSVSEDYHREIAQFHRYMEGLLGEDDLQAKNMWRNGISQDFNRFPTGLQFTSSHVWIAYGEPDFSIGKKGQHYLFVAFCIEEGKIPILRVGYSLSPKRSDDNLTDIVDNASDIVDFVRKNNLHLLHTERTFHVVERFDEEEEMTALLNSTDALGEIDRLQIAEEYSTETLTREAVTTKVANDLVRLHEFTYPRLYP